MKTILITLLLIVTGCSYQEPDVPSFKIDTLCNFEGILRCDANDGECWCVEQEEAQTWYVSLGLIDEQLEHQK